jgi:hypothetical protein
MFASAIYVTLVASSCSYVADVADEYTASRVATLSMKCSYVGIPSFPCCSLLSNAGEDEVEGRR